MACVPLPDHPRALEILLNQTAQFLDVMDPMLAKIRMQDLVLQKGVEDRQWLIQRGSVLAKQIQDETDKMLAAVKGPPPSTFLKYIDLDVAEGHLFGKKTFANSAPTRGLRPPPRPSFATSLASTRSSGDRYP